MPVYWHRGRIFMWFPFLADTNNLDLDDDAFDYHFRRLQQ